MNSNTPKRFETDALRAAVKRLHSMGIVGVHTPEEASDFPALQGVWQAVSLEGNGCRYTYADNRNCPVQCRSQVDQSFAREGTFEHFPIGSERVAAAQCRRARHCKDAGPAGLRAVQSPKRDCARF